MQQRQSPKPPMPNWAGFSKNLALWLLVALLAVFLFRVMGKQSAGTTECCQELCPQETQEI